jgi:hypothetical protein
MTAELITTMAQLDDLTATHVETAAPPSAGDVAHWTELNDPVGLALVAARPARVY